MDKINEFIRERLYTKSIAIKPQRLEWLKLIKGKKSIAGKLDEILEFYKLNNKI